MDKNECKIVRKSYFFVTLIDDATDGNILIPFLLLLLFFQSGHCTLLERLHIELVVKPSHFFRKDLLVCMVHHASQLRVNKRITVLSPLVGVCLRAICEDLKERGGFWSRLCFRVRIEVL